MHDSSIFSDFDISYAIEHGIINVACLSEAIEMNRRKEIVENHKEKYSIWQGKTNLCWYTHLPEKNGGLKKIKRKNYSDLEKDIYEFYKEKAYNPTIDDIFFEWLERKVTEENLLPQTGDRYKRQYQQLMSEFGKQKIRNISELDIENFVVKSIHKYHLTAKATSNLRILLKGIFRLAKKKGLVSFSISFVLEDMDISRKAYTKVVRENDDLIFTDEEFQKIYRYVMENQENPRALGILLLFYTGMRPGELAALRWEDIDDSFIHIKHMEEKFEKNGKTVYRVRSMPKTEAGIRTIPIPDCALWIIKLRKLHPSDEGYVFEANGKRLTIAAFDNYFRRMLQKIGVQQKSLSKIRKTYSSMLLDAKVEDSIVTHVMGHTDIKTTRTHYYKNRNNASKMSSRINSVFRNTAKVVS